MFVEQTIIDVHNIRSVKMTSIYKAKNFKQVKKKMA